MTLLPAVSLALLCAGIVAAAAGDIVAAPVWVGGTSPAIGVAACARRRSGPAQGPTLRAVSLFDGRVKST
jgi:hypothetical protein